MLLKFNYRNTEFGKKKIISHINFSNYLRFKMFIYATQKNILYIYILVYIYIFKTLKDTDQRKTRIIHLTNLTQENRMSFILISQVKSYT